MKRRMLNLLTALPLVLCVAIVLLWVSSYRVCLMVTHVGAHGRSLWAESHRGAVFFTLHRTTTSIGVSDPPPGWDFDISAADEVVVYETNAGVPVRRWVPLRVFFDVFPMDTHVAVVPHWVPLVALTALPAAGLLRRLRRDRRRRFETCASCNYDLRATPGRCPECGTSP